MKPTLTTHFAHTASAGHGLNLQDAATSSSSLAFGGQMNFQPAHAVEKSNSCPHIETLAQKLPAYGRHVL